MSSGRRLSRHYRLSIQSAALMNVVVYVSDALRADHLGCYGARFLNTKTIDELAAGGVRFDQAISAAPWTAPAMTSMVTGLYAHHHGYLHWDAELDPTHRDALPRALGVTGTRSGTFVFDRNYLFKEMPEANVARDERDARPGGRVAARATTRSHSCSSSTTGRRTCPTTSSTPSARTGSRRSRR